MTILIDAPRWSRRHDGMRFAHLVSDTSHDELHAFVEGLPLPRPLRFHDDHYDLPAGFHQVAIDHGAFEVSTHELVRRLRAAGLRHQR